MPETTRNEDSPGAKRLARGYGVRIVEGKMEEGSRKRGTDEEKRGLLLIDSKREVV